MPSVLPNLRIYLHLFIPNLADTNGDFSANGSGNDASITCGIMGTSSRIVGGSVVSPENKYPWQAYLRVWIRHFFIFQANIDDCHKMVFIFSKVFDDFVISML